MAFAAPFRVWVCNPRGASVGELLFVKKPRGAVSSHPENKDEVTSNDAVNTKSGLGSQCPVLINL